MRRVMILLIGMMIAATVQTRALDWNVFSLNQNPVPATAIVSFSIGYPKGWKVTQTANWRRDIYFDIATPSPGEIICSFWSPPPPAGTTNLTMFTIFDSHDRPAKEAAESIARNMKGYTKKRFSPVKTAAGDSGWLLESESNLKIFPPAEFKPNEVFKEPSETNTNYTVEKVVDHEYFFHSGSKGSIRIDIMTPASNSRLRSELDQLVMRTLRFSDS